ncbi:hypothetical protein IFO70_29960 [Phormidium tenue FACHB-886]|nr:hypothetical protein [Phormidium tenue FACHB-886]
MPRRKKPKFEEASSALDELVSTPRVKPKSALETVVERDFEKLVKAVDVGYSLSEICATLGRHGISSTPKLLKLALCNFAAETNRISELPKKLVAPPDKDGSTGNQEEEEDNLKPDEPDPDEIANQSSIKTSTEGVTIPRIGRKIETAY